MTVSRISFWRAAAAGWIGVIFFSSTSSAGRWSEDLFRLLSSVLFGRMIREGSTASSVLFLLADKGFHVSLFSVLALLLWRAIPEGTKKPVAIVLAGCLVGSASEFLQLFFPGRDPAIRDVLINLAGTVLGIGLAIRFADTAVRAATASDSNT